MKVNEVLTEAGVMDTLKAIAQQGMLSGVNNIRQTANRLANQRDVQQLADQMTKVWNNLTNRERDRLQGAGADGTIGEQKYKEMLANFIEKNIVANKLDSIADTNTKNEIRDVIQRIQDSRSEPRQFSALFRQLIVLGLIARMQQPSSQTTTQQQQQSGQPAPPRNADAVLAKLKDAGINTNDVNQIRAAMADMNISPIRTNDPSAIALLKTLGIPTS